MRASASFKAILISGTAFAALACPAHAQVVDTQTTTQPAATPTGAETPDESAALTGTNQNDGIVVTGSRIRRDPNDSALPLQIITTQEIERNGIVNPEQLLQYITTNGTGADNLASNADVVEAGQRGNNGASFANLRSQGSGATLVLLNGRRVAAHGQQGSAVDVNQIPFAAVERVEVLKEGASAIYGTDAIGGVINFILRKDYQGLGVQGFVDVAEEGDHTIYRTSAIAGYGDLSDQGFNIMGAVSYSTIPELRGDRRDFVNTFQPDRGLSPDTRGTPHATILPLAGTFITPGNTSVRPAPIIPGTDIRASGGINVLDLPGAEGCASIDGQGPYDDELWDFPQAQLACAWDTGRAAVLQQPLETLTYIGRGVVRLGDHEIAAEVTGSDATAIKRFSDVQLIPNTSSQNYSHPSTGVNYGRVFDRLVAYFPELEARRGQSLGYRWRCTPCGRREIVTDTQTFRVALGADGPLFSDWDYRTGASYASSESSSELGGGFYFRGTLGNGAPDPNAPIAPGAPGPGLIGLLNSGIVNVFPFPGESQSAAALAGLDAVSAEGVVLYGGKYSVTQVDASVSGSLFNLPAGALKAAFGVDYRREKYRFNGDEREAASRPVIIAAPFDDANALEGASRDVKAAYVEFLIPVLRSLEVTAALRVDDYEGFGTTTNPLVAFKFRPFEPLMFRGNYNTAFRAPNFNQINNGVQESLYTGRDFADPGTCPGGRADSNVPGCASLERQVDLLSGGNQNIGPETAEMYSLGVVFQPAPLFSASVDYYSISRDDTITVLGLEQLIDNFDLFPERFIRQGGNLVAIDQTVINAGQSKTEGLEIAMRGGFDTPVGLFSAGLDGTYLLTRQDRVVEGAEFVDRIGVFSFSGDLGLKWKHNAFVSYTNDDLFVTLTQLFRSGYENQQLPGIENGSVTRPNVVEDVDDYIIYNLSVGFSGVEGVRLTVGVKNLFDTDPPFAISYNSNTGAGSSWESRVADPRGRSYTLSAEVKF